VFNIKADARKFKFHLKVICLHCEKMFGPAGTQPPELARSLKHRLLAENNEMMKTREMSHKSFKYSYNANYEN
jgi:hypothetical protein